MPTIGLRGHTGEPDTPDVAADFAVIAFLQAAQGRLDEAQALHERALYVFERLYGPHHYEVASAPTG